MDWTEEDKAKLLSYRDNLESDDIRFKECIKQTLLKNKLIAHVLNNEELEKSDAEIDEYFGINILSYYIIHPTQTKVKNFICYEVNFDEQARYNEAIKYGEIIFTILCEQKNIKDKDTGLARHDLLAALILHDFNWSNIFGTQVHCVSDVSSVVDTDYACRTLIFRGKMPNNLLNDNKIINKLGRTK